MAKYFITGTDTGIGKTLVSSILIQGLNAAYWKPVQSGTLEQTDSEFVEQFTDIKEEQLFPETYKLTQPLSPHASAAIDNVQIELDRFQMPDYQKVADHLIIEGAGGLLVPLNKDRYIIDLMKQLDCPAILVARSALGTINHTLLSLAMLSAYGIKTAGVILSGEKNAGNRKAIEEYGKVPIIAEVDFIDVKIDKNLLQDIFDREFKPALHHN